MEFEREELIELRDRTETEATYKSNEGWRRAHLRLADAADHLDAMIARTEEKK